MDKKIILVTGASDGIGRETATTLAGMGHTVIVHGRDKSKTQAVVEEIRRQTMGASVDMAIANLLSMKDTKRMAEEISAKYDHLDVLINNAGAVFTTERQLTEDGEEHTFQLNVFAPFLLTHLLMPLLRKSASGRVVFEASAAHTQARKPDFTDMHCEKVYSAQGNYNLSKLYAIWVAKHFAAELQKQGIGNVTVNATHPGMVGTKFGQNEKKGFWVDMIYKWTLKLGMMSSVADGARSEIYLATSPEVEGVTGKFYSNKCREAQPSQKHYSPENEQAIWDYCMKVCEKYI